MIRRSRKIQAKADIGIFVGYAPSRKGYRIYKRELVRVMEIIHVTFDEMHQSMAPARMSSGPEPLIMTPGQLKSGLAPTDKELEMIIQPNVDEHSEHLESRPVSSAMKINAQVLSNLQHQEIAEEPIHEDTPIIHDVLHPSHNLVTGDPGSAQSSSGNVNSAEPNQVNYPPDHLRRWTKDHPLDNIVGNPSRPVSTRKQLASDALWCCYRSAMELQMKLDEYEWMSKLLISEFIFKKKSLSVQPEDLKTGKSTYVLSSEEGLL
ncbi:hypothetical protein Tco_0783926 [Tanacetum coccineum]